ncbi:type VII secretion protein EccCb [Dactylosporangium sp. CA-139066]|uniref:type VII secretion protein EccCb n=1 Tax=Dactylosporangium sp. CA-139066 TaxID=3239930 RepID=UPI003D92871E
MSTVIRTRASRRAEPEYPAGELVLDAPPVLPASPARSWPLLLTVVPLLVGAGSMALLFAGQPIGPLVYLTGGLFLLSVVGVLAVMFGRGTGPGRRERLLARQAYLRHLGQRRRQARRSAQMQRATLLYRHPDPDALWSIPPSRRLWERRPGDTDFAVVRVALGPQALATPIVAPPARPLDDPDPMSALALRRFMASYAAVDNLPVAIPLGDHARLHVQGSPEQARALARAIVAQAAAFHSPDDLIVAVCAGPGAAAQWEWAKWLPHAQHPKLRDALGPARLVAPSVVALETLLDPITGNRPRFEPGFVAPHVLLVLDGGDELQSAHLLRPGGVAGVTVLDLSPRPSPLDGAATVSIDGYGTLLRATAEGWTPAGRADALSLAEAEALALQLAPLRPDSPDASETTGDLALLGLDAVDDFDPAARWSAAGEGLRVRLGWSPDGAPVELDLDRDGPHGLVIAADDAGRAELLRAIVAGLAVAYGPERINFLLVDAHGAGTFAGLDALPHTGALIAGLATQPPLVDRLAQTIEGELRRRRSARPDASLVIVGDGLGDVPGLAAALEEAGRARGPLGVHLLLASRRLDEGRSRALDAHLTYRIGLGPAPAGDPDVPGRGHLSVGSEPPRPFRPASVSGLYGRSAPAAPVIHDYVAAYVPSATPADAPPVASAGAAALDVLVARMRGQGVPAHPLWLPPLAESPTLGALLPAPVADPQRGLTVPAPELQGGLYAAIGVVDRPLEQRRDPLWWELAGPAGHAIVVGGPASGKSTVLRTLILGLALSHTPAEATFHCLDFGGGGLQALRDLPHVAGVLALHDQDAVRRTVAGLQSLRAARQRRFAASSVDSMATYRRLRRAGQHADDPFGDVFLVIDGWSALRDFPDLAEALDDLTSRGLTYGVHVVATATRWPDVPAPVRERFGSRVELRLTEPTDSQIDRRAAANVPDRAPGRGLIPGGLQFLGALPRLDGRPTTEDLAEGVASLVTQIREATPKRDAQQPA